MVPEGVPGAVRFGTCRIRSRELLHARAARSDRRRGVVRPTVLDGEAEEQILIPMNLTAYGSDGSG